MSADTDLGLSIERRSIEPVPQSERHGGAASLFAVWFGANLHLTTIITGAIGVVLGLPLPWAILALVVGNLFGAVFMALHSAQGPKLGVPQMIQSRAQFGVYGAVVPLLLVIAMYVGFYAGSIVLGGQALADLTGLPFPLSAGGLSAAITLLTIYGYRAIHRLERVTSVLAGIAFLWITGRALFLPGLSAAVTGPISTGTFLLVISIAATWQITYAPYVADYSRYLPESTPVRSAFWWTYAGSAIAAIWMMTLGAVVVSIAPGAFAHGSSAFLLGLVPGPFRWAFSLVLILGIVAAEVLNLYGMFMSTVTAVTAFTRTGLGGAGRTVYIVGASIVGTSVGILASGDFMANFKDFILFLAYFLIPWTAINLADYYLIRKERYDLAAIYDPNGIYGRINWRTMTAYLIAVLAQLPFVSSGFYTGPFVAAFGGADLAWVVGLIVPAVLYVVLMRPVLNGQQHT
ncbi:MAG TPA: cytosine permease [Alphaproteobacteria bacterium]|nr:cytosine permease [Alphaproteobacteria bacterium]